MVKMPMGERVHGKIRVMLSPEAFSGTNDGCGSWRKFSRCIPDVHHTIRVQFPCLRRLQQLRMSQSARLAAGKETCLKSDKERPPGPTSSHALPNYGDLVERSQGLDLHLCKQLKKFKPPPMYIDDPPAPKEPGVDMGTQTDMAARPPPQPTCRIRPLVSSPVCTEPCERDLERWLSSAMLQQIPVFPLANDAVRPRSPTPVNISESGTVQAVLSSTKMEPLPKADSDPDVTLVIDKTKYVVSRSILEQQSRYFREVLVSVNHCQHIRLVIGGLSASAFELALDWMQGKDVPYSDDVLADVFLVAVKLDIPGLTQEIVRCLKMWTGSRDLVDLYEYALATGPEALCEGMHLLVVASFLQIARSGRFQFYTPQRVYMLLTDDALGILSEWEVWEAALRWLAYNLEERKKDASLVLSAVRFGLIPEEHLLVAATDPRSRFASEHPACHYFMLRGFMSHAVKRLHLETYYSNLLPPPRLSLEGSKLKSIPTTNPFDDQTRNRRRIYNVENMAAAIIQAGFRGYTTRKRLSQQHMAASTIQAAFRGHLTREQLQMLARKATIIASWYRGYRVRRALKVLRSIGEQLRVCTDRGGVALLPRPSKKHNICLRGPSILTMGGLDPQTSWNGCGVGCFMFRYDPCHDCWEDIGSLPEAMHHAAATTLDGMIYITGGCVPEKSSSGQQILGTVRAWCLRPHSGEWTRLPNMNHSRVYHNMVALKGRLMVLGGQNSKQQLLGSVEWFDPVDGRAWERGLRMMRPRMGAAAAEFRGRVWVCGGLGRVRNAGCENQSRLGILSSVECYDGPQNCWVVQQPLPQPRCFASLVPYANALHLVGGATASNYCNHHKVHDETSILLLDPDMQDWEERLALICGRHGAAAVQLGRRLIAFGGISCEMHRCLSSVESFLGTQSAPTLADLPQPLTGMSVVLLPKRNSEIF